MEKVGIILFTIVIGFLIYSLLHPNIVLKWIDNIIKSYDKLPDKKSGRKDRW